MLLLLLESQRKVMKNRKTKVKEKNANFRHHRHAGKWWVATKRRWRRMLHSDFCDSNLPLWLPTLSYLSCSTGSLGIRCRVLFFFWSWSFVPGHGHCCPCCLIIATFTRLIARLDMTRFINAIAALFRAAFPANGDLSTWFVISSTSLDILASILVGCTFYLAHRK